MIFDYLSIVLAQHFIACYWGRRVATQIRMPCHVSEKLLLAVHTEHALTGLDVSDRSHIHIFLYGSTLECRSAADTHDLWEGPGFRVQTLSRKRLSLKE